MQPSTIYKRWDVVIVPFPFTERAGVKRRPALVLSTKAFNENGHVVLAMITTKTHSRWPGDTSLEGLADAGLSVPCIVRLKIFTLDGRLILRRSGACTQKDRTNVLKALRRYVFSTV